MIGYVDLVGLGFEKIKNACNDYSNSNPIIEDKNTFKVYISLVSIDNIETEEILHKEKILAYIFTNGRINNKEGRELLRF